MHGILGMFNWIHKWYVPGGRRSLTEIGEVFAEMIFLGLAPLNSVPAERNSPCHR